MQQIRLSGIERKQLADAIKADIDAFCVQNYPNEHRNHLGASEIGEKCSRKLWYIFRWMHKEQFDGRMLRLFNRGHQTENRIIDWLNGIGAEVLAHSDDGNQFRISGAKQHFGGSLDGIVRLPPKYNLLIHFLAEFKTHNLKSFNKLVKGGVGLSKPKHVAQMNTYGADEMYSFDYALYFGLCKDNDEIYVEVVALDHQAGAANVAKAANIIFSSTVPGRISGSPAFSECTYCSMKGICHLKEPVDINCRSCKFSVPVEDGEWFCNNWNALIPKLEIPNACPQWTEIEHR